MSERPFPPWDTSDGAGGPEPLGGEGSFPLAPGTGPTPVYARLARRPPSASELSFGVDLTPFGD